MIKNFFNFEQHQTTYRTETIAGVTTFLTMAYIIFVNPAILSETGMDKTAVVVVTCLIAAVSTLMMAVFPKVPIALAPGMGLNAFFTYSLVIGHGITWQAALGIVFWAGLIFLILSLVGARRRIVQSIPPCMVSSIPAGIGLFLLFIGFQNLGLISSNPNTLVSFAGFTKESLIGVTGLFLIIFLMSRKIKGSILIGILFSTLLSAALGLIQVPDQWFTTDIDISPVAFQLDLTSALKWSLIGPIFALLYVDMFDTLGTLLACSQEARLVNKQGEIQSLGKMLNVDAVATMLSGVLGTSPTTSYVESATGIAEGGRTGFTSVVTGLLFLSALAIIPIISIVPAYATAPALIMVGVIMLKQIRNVDFSNFEDSVPAILTVAIMPLTFSISVGMAFGFLSWGLIKIFLGKFKAINWVVIIVILLSLLSLIK